MDKLNLIEIEIDLKQELQRKQRHLSNRDQCRTTNDRWDLKTLLFIAKKKKTTTPHNSISTFIVAHSKSNQSELNN